jgi:hypothetical protein
MKFLGYAISRSAFEAEHGVDRSLVRPAILLWCARVAWGVLPATTGGAIADAIDGWPSGPVRAATVLLWAAWAAGLLALLAPRPWGLTVLRVIAPLAIVCTVASVTSTSAISALIAIASSVIGAALALSEPVVAASGNALAYGDEVRFPMRIPTPLLLGPVPLAIALIGAGAVSGVLFLSDANIIAGVVLVVVGLPVASIIARSLDALSHRWVVLVPAGIAIVDPLTLTDPVLLRRDTVTRVVPVPGKSRPARVLDLRLGTLAGGIEIKLAAPATFGRRRGRAGAELLECDVVTVAVTRPDALLALAADRRMPTR